MGALDEVLGKWESACHEDFSRTEFDEAREELELLRELAFRSIQRWTTHHRVTFGEQTELDEEDVRILRTDPERAKKMGLGWAL